MDMLDHALDGSGQPKGEDDEDVQLVHEDSEDQTGGMTAAGAGTISLDPSVQYQFRTDTGHGTIALDPSQVQCLQAEGEEGAVTYRVVQVTQNEDGQTQVMASVPSGASVAPNVIQFNNNGEGNSPPTEHLGNDTRFTYVPAVTTGDEGGTAALGQVTAGGGQFYVMMSPQDVLQAGQRTIAPRTGITPRIEGGRTSRDERRRATHNEVERRRRDKINSWIVQLSKLVPDCAQDVNKQGQVVSKGGILTKTCDYIEALQRANAQMAEGVKQTEQISMDVSLLQQQCKELKHDNALLRAQLQQHGIVPADLSGGST